MVAVFFSVNTKDERHPIKTNRNQAIREKVYQLSTRRQCFSLPLSRRNSLLVAFQINIGVIIRAQPHFAEVGLILVEKGVALAFCTAVSGLPDVSQVLGNI